MIDIEKRFSLLELDSIVEIIVPYLKSNSTIALNGEMGAGKTTLVKCLLSHLEVNAGEVSSPTYAFCNLYYSNVGDVYHYDLYRIDSNNQHHLDAIEIEKNLNKSICIIEWAKKLAILPQNTIHIELEYIDELTRQIKIKQK